MKQSLFCLLLLTPQCGLAQLTSQNDERLKEGLRKFPAADADKDAVLTLAEAVVHMSERKKKGKAARRSRSQAAGTGHQGCGLWGS